jgi:hypothetical protein
MCEKIFELLENKKLPKGRKIEKTSTNALTLL